MTVQTPEIAEREAKVSPVETKYARMCTAEPCGLGVIRAPREARSSAKASTLEARAVTCGTRC